MDNRTIKYYDRESSQYTDKRYAPVTESYIQYVFKTRLQIFLSFLAKIEKSLPEKATIMEIGCADGVIFKAIENRFPGRFHHLVGVDISSDMIREATKKNNNERAEFFLRENEPNEKFDVVVELGVHPFDLRKEAKHVVDRLNIGGYFFYDAVSSGSLYGRIKLRDAWYVKDYMPYKKYDDLLRNFFLIKETRVYGLFIPKLWKYPALGRLSQSAFDALFRYIFPSLFHEKIYILKLESN